MADTTASVAAADRQSNSAKFNILLFAVMTCVCCSVTSDPLRPMLLREIAPSLSVEGVSTILGQLTAAGALSEFLITPTMGRLGDKYGRKPFLVGALLTTAFANFVTFVLAPRQGGLALPLLVVERCLKTAADTIFHTSVRAAASDFMTGTELTLSSARFAMAAGVGVLIGPSFTTRFLYPVFNNARLPQGVNMCVMTALAAFFAFSFKETLEPERSVHTLPQLDFRDASERLLVITAASRWIGPAPTSVEYPPPPPPPPPHTHTHII